MEEPRWLDEDEQRIWRSYLLGHARLNELLDRDLREHHDLSLAEYEVLVRLSEAGDRSMRMAELAEFSNQSRSRLSHTVDRLARDGLVARNTCDDDRRGVWAILTDAGFRRLAEAACTHVRGVRAYFVDAVRGEDYRALGRAFDAILGNIAAAEERPESVSR
ncbi:MAG: MarR family transcriptional regulator [Streptosporangiales bacterium]|nr:MarR family transcriptional regulator [Streptosporangiales bacterium]